MATATRALNLKNIPIISSNATISDWNASKFVLDSICSMNKCKHFLKMNKHVSLPDTKEPGTGRNHLANEIIAVEKHALCVHIMVLSCQKNKELVALLKATESEDWPGGEMHLFFFRGIEKHFKLTMTTANVLKQEIKKEEALDALSWG